MNRIRLAVIGGVVLAFAAGGSVGMLIRSRAKADPRGRGRRGPGLARELGLTNEQQAEMKAIWSKVMTREDMEQSRARRQEMRKQRDAGIQALLTDEQRQRYRQILDEYQRGLEQMSLERRQRIDQAVEQTKAILTPAQRQKYEEIRKSRRRPFRGGRGRGPGGPPPFGGHGGRHHPRTREAPDAGAPRPAKPEDETKTERNRREAPAGDNGTFRPGSSRLAWACVNTDAGPRRGTEEGVHQ